jgi:hypothetical protein
MPPKAGLAWLLGAIFFDASIPSTLALAESTVCYHLVFPRVVAPLVTLSYHLDPCDSTRPSRQCRGSVESSDNLIRSEIARPLSLTLSLSLSGKYKGTNRAPSVDENRVTLNAEAPFCVATEPLTNGSPRAKAVMLATVVRAISANASPVRGLV